MHGDRLALHVAQRERGDHQGAVVQGQQGDDPAGGGLVVAIEGVQLVDLAGATHFEQGLQWRQVRLAELGHVVGFQGQFDGLAGVQASPVDTGDQLGCLGLHDTEQQGGQRGKREGGEAGHRVFP
ncbi:hypothetical protein D3C84_485030 [compost metagenome]